MKTKLIDYILVSLAVAFNLFISLAGTFFLSKLTAIFLKKYHILIDVLFLLFLYFIVTGIFIRLCLRIRPLKEGAYEMTDKEMTYWKFIQTVTELIRMPFLPFIPFFCRPDFFRWLGVKVGKDVEIVGNVFELPLLEFDDYVIVGAGALVIAHAITHDKVVLKRVKVSRKVTIGMGAIVLPGVEIGENSIVAAGAVVPMDTHIPPNEVWAGVPARKIKEITRADSSKQTLRIKGDRDES